MKSAIKIAVIRSFGYWVRVCSGGPVKYIIVDPDGDEDGWMRAGNEAALNDTMDDLEISSPETVALEVKKAERARRRIKS